MKIIIKNIVVESVEENDPEEDCEEEEEEEEDVQRVINAYLKDMVISGLKSTYNFGLFCCCSFLYIAYKY